MKLKQIQEIYFLKKLKTSKQLGYSINEMVIVIAIIGILASILFIEFK